MDLTYSKIRLTENAFPLTPTLTLNPKAQYLQCFRTDEMTPFFGQVYRDTKFYAQYSITKIRILDIIRNNFDVFCRHEKKHRRPDVTFQ